jgi:hypothetical protein
MSDTKSETSNGRDPASGRFLPGNIGGGRPKGSRGKLSERFISDLYERWEQSGAQVLKTVAETDPVALMRVVAGLIPTKIDASLAIIDADLLKEQKTFMDAYRIARQIIGADTDDTPLIEAKDEAKASN